MKEARQNLWMTPADALCITTNGTVKNNGECVMGRGCAAEAKCAFPAIAKELGDHIRRDGNHVGVLMGPDPYIISFPVKHQWWEEADPNLIRQSTGELVELADARGWQQVVLPRPGCGNGRLNWADVKPILEERLDDRFTVVYF